MDWNQEQIAELTRLWQDGLSTSEIGKRLGISKNAVVGKAHRLHLAARPSPIRRGVGLRAPRPAPRPRRTAPPRVLELSNNACRWPIGHPGEPGFHFCSERALVGKPYCAEHTELAYVRARPKPGEAA
jgi:GcrA cell cycle regulator